MSKLIKIKSNRKNTLRISYYDDMIIVHYLDNNNQFHRIKKPAVMFFHPDRTLEHISYYNNGYCYNKNGPCVITYNLNKTITAEFNDFTTTHFDSLEDLQKYVKVQILK